MKRFSMPKKALVVSAVLGSVVGLTAAAVGAWGPDRKTFTVASPAPYVTFNSITDNPNYGDERTFYDVKDAKNTNHGGFVDRVKVQDGQELLLRTYVHNNAADNLNGTNFDGPGVAKNTKVRVHLPTATDKALRSNSYVTADNANPGSVHDTVDFYADDAFSIEYVPGSAVSYTNAVPSGYKLSDSIVSNGALVGYKGADGIVPGCFEYTAIVTIKVKVKMAPKPAVSVDKLVRVKGETEWKTSNVAKPGDTLEYQIAYKNTGNTTHNKVLIRDNLPPKMQYVNGSTKLKNSAGVKTAPDGVTTTGITVGNYTPGAAAYVLFEAKVPAADQLACGVTEFRNVGVARPEGMNEFYNTAITKVTKECKEVPTYNCELFKIKQDANRTVSVTDLKTTQANGATFKDVVIDWGDNSAKLVTNNAVGKTHQYATDGDYTITATARFTVNGQTKEVSGPQCVQKVSFKAGEVVTPVTTPTVLPNTGAGDVIAIAALVAVAGTVAHRLVLARRF